MTQKMTEVMLQETFFKQINALRQLIPNRIIPKKNMLEYITRWSSKSKIGQQVTETGE